MELANPSGINPLSPPPQPQSPPPQRPLAQICSYAGQRRGSANTSRKVREQIGGGIQFPLTEESLHSKSPPTVSDAGCVNQMR